MKFNFHDKVRYVGSKNATFAPGDNAVGVVVGIDTYNNEYAFDVLWNGTKTGLWYGPQDLELVESVPSPTKNTEYTVAFIFEKETDMMEYFNNKESPNLPKEAYKEPRKVNLVALVRYEGNRTFVKIKCPINPFPFKEGEIVKMSVFISALNSLGWKLKEKHNLNLFQ